LVSLFASSIRNFFRFKTWSTGENAQEGDKETIIEERKQLLELNHLIAKQVMEKTRLAAGRFCSNHQNILS